MDSLLFRAQTLALVCVIAVMVSMPIAGQAEGEPLAPPTNIVLETQPQPVVVQPPPVIMQPVQPVAPVQQVAPVQVVPVQVAPVSSAKPDYAQKLFDIVIMALMTFLGPLITKHIGALSPTIRYGISNLIGAILGIVSGEYTNFPMQPDTAMAAGMALSSLGQKFTDTQPAQGKGSEPIPPKVIRMG